MGLETGTRIEDLVDTNPNNDPDQVTQGDDHLRLLKVCIQGSFPSLGPDQVTVTALQLNAVIDKLATFNGRSATAVVPDATDYSATNEGFGGFVPGKLADFGDWSSVANGDLPEWTGNGFEPLAKTSLFAEVAEFQADDAQGLGSTNTRAIFFDTSNINTITASSVATVVNGSGVGFSITADKPCVVDITFSDGRPSGGQNANIGIAVNGSRTTDPLSQAAGVLRTFHDAGTDDNPLVHACSVVLAVNDFVWINSSSPFQDDDDSSVQAVVTEIKS